MAKQIVHGEDSRQAILRGVNTLADAVKTSPRHADCRGTEDTPVAGTVQTNGYGWDQERFARGANHAGGLFSAAE